MRIPKFLVCPHCNNPFERGKLVFRYTCPSCHRYINIIEIDIFFTSNGSRLSGYSMCKGLRKLNKRETIKIKEIIRKKFIYKL